MQYKLCVVIRYYVRETFEEEIGYRPETEDFLRHVYGYGVKTDNLEKYCAFFPPLDIYKVIEYGEHRDGVCSGSKDESGVP